MTAALDSPGQLHVLRVDVVKWAIGHLTQQKIHAFFPAYLHLRAVALEVGSTQDIPARLAELGPLLEVPGGPPRKPYYRPMLHRLGTSPWLNSNLAGSYAPSSTRDSVRTVVSAAGGLYSLLDGHVDLASEHLLFNDRLSAAALSVFFYRNRGFSGPELNIACPVKLLLTEFRLDQPDSSDFTRLFTLDTPGIPTNLFEPFSPDEAPSPDGSSTP